MAGSHEVRSGFEKLALWVFVGSLAAIFIAALVGILWPPVKGGPDWGASIVDRLKQLKDSLGYFWEILLGGPAISWIRGHMDARLTDNKPG